MQLVEVAIENFHGAKERTVLPVKQLSLLVGKNDAGKSTILKALDHFLNETAISADSANVQSGSYLITIELAFNPQQAEIIIDDAIQTTFENEELLDSNELLRVKKTWDVSLSKPKLTTFITRKAYKGYDFVMENEGGLIKLCKNLQIDTKKANGDEFNNVEKRIKIRDQLHMFAAECEYVEEKLPTSGNSRQKAVLDELRKALPKFEYFKADTSLSEADTSIQNYFREIAGSVLENNEDVTKIETAISSRLEKVLISITDRINSVVRADEQVRPHLEFDWSKIVKTTFRTENEDYDVPLRLRGDGFRRISMMAYFEHLAHEKHPETRSAIYGFEEPETFLHPSAQEQLFDKLFQMSERGYQLLVATHSPIIVANSARSDLIHVYKENHTIRFNTDQTDIRPLADDLGIRLDNQFVNLFEQARVLMLVEGPDDVGALEHIAAKYKENGLIDRDFQELDVIIIPIGGCDSIKHWVTLDLLKRLSKPFFIYLDSDKDSDQAVSPNRKRLVEEFGFIENRHFAITRKRMIENYIPCAALNRLVPGAGMNYGDWEHVKHLCKQHPLHDRLGGASVTKRHFKKLTFEELKQTLHPHGASDEFMDIYQSVRNLVQY